jgi:hypothetical protein
VAEANALAIGVSGLEVVSWLGVSVLLRRYGKKLKREEVLVILGIAGEISWLSRWYEKSKSEVGTLGMEVLQFSSPAICIYCALEILL